MHRILGGEQDEGVFYWNDSLNRHSKALAGVIEDDLHE